MAHRFLHFLMTHINSPSSPKPMIVQPTPTPAAAPGLNPLPPPPPPAGVTDGVAAAALPIALEPELVVVAVAAPVGDEVGAAVAIAARAVGPHVFAAASVCSSNTNPADALPALSYPILNWQLIGRPQPLRLSPVIEKGKVPF